MTTSKFAINDLVWAKMKGFSPWPGKIVDGNSTHLKKPTSNVGKKTSVTHCIYFFGSNNYGWIQEESIKPYLEFKEPYSKLTKTKSFKAALEVIEEYIRTDGASLALDGNVNASDGALDDGKGANLPSIDEELATIFTGGKGDGETANSSGTAASGKTNNTNATHASRDYSRTPFKPKTTKAKASAAATSASASQDGEDGERPAKRVRSTSSQDDQVNASASAGSKSPTKNTTTSGAARNLLARTSQYLLDSNTNNDQSEVDMKSVSAKAKSIRASSLKFGFIGLGLMGQRLLKNLLTSGHTVTIWNRTPSKCKDFIKAGATKATTPADVVAASDIVFSCLADPHAVKEIVFGNCGVLAEIRSSKGYVEMTTIDPDTSNDISEAILSRGGRYLEAPIIGSGKLLAEQGDLTVIVAGDKTLFDECNSCFQAMSKHAFYLGSQVGDSTKMNLVVSMLIGNLIGSLAESMALADRTGLSQKDLLEILSLSPLNCHTILSKGKAMIEGGFATEMPLTHMQKDLRLGLQLGEFYEHPLPITASTNEVFKHAKHLGYSDHDVAAVYIRSRF